MTVAILAVFLVGLLWPGSVPVHAWSYEVDNDADDANAHDVTPGDYICADSYGVCTLRAAIEEANAQGGPHTITFKYAMQINIDPSVGALPPLNEQIKIDASAVWDTADDEPGVTIHGSFGSYAGLMPNAVGCEIYGLYVTGFDGTGIYISSSNNTIGGTGAGQRNVVSGNPNNTGITMSGSGANNNYIGNNYIGLTALGTTTNPNGTGILLTGGANHNVIGGNDTSHGNLIAGNTTNGVVIEGTGTDGNLLSNNRIGLGSDPTIPLPNGQYGVRIQNGPANTIIGGTDGSGNVITNNGSSGVYIGNAGDFNEVSWNLIGSNTLDGVSIYDTANTYINDNVVSSNTLGGVRVSGVTAAGNLIWPNSITANGSKGIIIQDGANNGIAVPTIAGAIPWGASGTSCTSCRVAIYSDSSDEGQIYHDVVWADGSGNWTYTGGPLLGPYLTATSIDTSGNTSEFSSPLAVTVAAVYKVYLPLIRTD
jgi:hypothetical protein